MAAESLGVPRNPSGALGEASGILGGPSEGPQGSLGGNNYEKPVVFDTFCEAGTSRAQGKLGDQRIQEDPREGQKWV